ncbi:hypothetical protein [Blastococcus tunisiensis]|uniref:Uncharacterized protein n=1 Tax=Blastococcus tunisiensis TaxID=1798228 RepID=A0A1I2DSL8_9ACTN|nr:hypothetical protein [Blastococcus sp. DSM 46838]SFE83457.1 hypothetical protein SAMN05216574_106107 [Blastococcus sp. DSM 46838]
MGTVHLSPVVRSTDVAAPPPESEEQAVLVTLCPSTLRGQPEVTVLSDSVEDAILAAGAGELDGHQTHGSVVTLFAYGPDAEQLWRSMEAVVRGFPHQRGHVTIRYGLFGAPCRELAV